MGLVCPDSPPIACLVEFDDETVAASGLVSGSKNTKRRWRNLGISDLSSPA